MHEDVWILLNLGGFSKFHASFQFFVLCVVNDSSLPVIFEVYFK